MALQIRRGVDGSGTGGRLTITPATGELLYTTDTKRLYIGDGTTVGGNIMTGSGISNLVEDATPQLGGDLDVNGFSIVSADGVDININPGIGGQVLLNSVINIDGLGNVTKTGQLNFSPTGVFAIGNNTTPTDGNVYITRNSYSTGTQDGFTFAQHHNTADSVNFQFLRTRGTGEAPTALLNGDDIIDMWFLGRHDTAQTLSAALSVIVDGVPTATAVPAKFSFATNNGTSTAIRAELSSAGVWKVNNLQNFSGTDLTLTATTVKVAGDLQLNAQGDLRFADADSSNWVAFQAPATVTSNVTWTLPAVDGTTGQVLSTNGGGALSWVTASAGGALSSRTTGVGSTGTIANAATANVTITGFKSYMLTKIETTHASWIRIYTDTASRLADASRLEGTDPLPGSGVIAEIIATGSGTFLISPGTLGFNNESVPTTAIELAVTNKSGASADISITLALLQLEA